MYRWLLLLMIALVPVRGWVGDAMASQMFAWQTAAAQQAVGGSHAVAMAAQPRSHDGSHRGHEFAQQAAGEDDGWAQAHGEFSSCSSCVSCQACSSAAPIVAVETSQAPALAFHFPASSDFRFASADRTPGLKPPIS